MLDPDPMFKTARDYHELNAGAHRKPPKVLSAPALVWHLAFWTNFQDEKQQGQPGSSEWAPNKRPEDINRAIDSYIRGLWRSLEEFQVELAPCIDDVYLLFGGAYRSSRGPEVPQEELTPRQIDFFVSTNRIVSLQFNWKHLDVTIRFETQAEYFTMSIFVELDPLRIKQETRAPPSDIGELNAVMQQIVAYLRNPVTAGKTEPEQAAQAAEVEQVVKGINRYCFRDFWRRFDEDLLSFSETCRKDPIFQHVYADLRGFIASDQAVTFDDTQFFQSGAPPRWGGEAKQKLLPLIQHRVRAQHIRYECAVNYMLEGRALYLSTLGPQSPDLPEGQRTPVEFIVYAHQRINGSTVVNKWQLGRLVSQILLLGTLRLSALKDVRWLHKAGLELAELEEATQRARRAIAATEAYAKGAGASVPVTEVSSRNTKAMMEIAAAHQKLNDITGAFLSDAGSGPLYRIERSRYYVRQFDDNVKLLRILRLEGDQPYDQFIRRRLGQEFDFIDRLGIRYERATSSIVSLDQNYLSITQNSLVERATKIDEETKSIQSEIGLIQRWGEFILLSCLVPYYVSHMLVLIVGDDWPLRSRAALAVWILSFGFAIYRAFNQTWSQGKLIGTLLLLGLLEVALGVKTSMEPSAEHHQQEVPKFAAPREPDRTPAVQPPSLQGAGPLTPTPEPSVTAPGATVPDATPIPQPSPEPR